MLHSCINGVGHLLVGLWCSSSGLICLSSAFLGVKNKERKSEILYLLSPAMFTAILNWKGVPASSDSGFGVGDGGGPFIFTFTLLFAILFTFISLSLSALLIFILFFARLYSFLCFSKSHTASNPFGWLQGHSQRPLLCQNGHQGLGSSDNISMLDQQAVSLQSSLALKCPSGKFKTKNLWVILVRFIFNYTLAVRSKANTFFFLLKEGEVSFPIWLPESYHLFLFPLKKFTVGYASQNWTQLKLTKEEKKYNFKAAAPQGTLTTFQCVASGCPSPNLIPPLPLSGLELFKGASRKTLIWEDLKSRKEREIWTAHNIQLHFILLRRTSFPTYGHLLEVWISVSRIPHTQNRGWESWKLDHLA